MSVDDLIFPFSFALIPTATVTPLAFLLPHWFPSLAPPLTYLDHSLVIAKGNEGFYMLPDSRFVIITRNDS